VLVVAVAVAASVVAVVLSLGRSSDNDVDESFNSTTPTAFPAERGATAGIAAELH
jgi:hypothetical protein